MMTKALEPQTEWVRIEDANRRLLFEMSLTTGCVRIKKRELTTVVDLDAERRRRLQLIFAEAVT